MAQTSRQGHSKMRSLAVATMLVTMTAMPATGQDSTTFSILPPTYWVDQLPLQLLANDLKRREERDAAGDAATPPPAARAVTATTTYDASPAVRDRVENQYIEFIGQNAPADAEIVRADLARFNAPDAWARIVGRTGFRSGDVADAIAAYWILNWMIANKETADRPDDRARAAAVKRQVAGIIATNPNFIASDNAQKQEMAESLMLNFIYQHKSFSEAARTNDRGMQNRLADAAVARFRNEMGVDLRELRLTDQGFVPAD